MSLEAPWHQALSFCHKFGYKMGAGKVEVGFPQGTCAHSLEAQKSQARVPGGSLWSS